MGKSLKGKELGTGICQRKDGLYQGYFVDRFGKRQTLYGKTVNEITQKLTKAKYENEKALNVATSDTTFSEWVETWIDIYKSDCRNSTITVYRRALKGVESELGWRRLQSIGKIHVQKAINELRTTHSKKYTLSLLKDLFGKAVECEILVKNPARGVITGKAEAKKEKRILSESETCILLEGLKNTTYLREFVIVALNTGMRSGEILGLCWSDVDFEKSEIDISKTLLYPKASMFEFHPPKTASGKRTIPMTKECKTALLRQKMYCNKVMMHHESMEGFEDLVFVTSTGKPVSGVSVNTQLKEHAKAIDISFTGITCHSLRHTFATNCIEKGMKPKVLQKILGHSSLRMTMDLYCHVRTDAIKEEMRLFAELA